MIMLGPHKTQEKYVTMYYFWRRYFHCLNDIDYLKNIWMTLPQSTHYPLSENELEKSFKIVDKLLHSQKLWKSFKSETGCYTKKIIIKDGKEIIVEADDDQKGFKQSIKILKKTLGHDDTYVAYYGYMLKIALNWWNNKFDSIK